MSKEPKTIGELFIYMDMEFRNLKTEIENMKKEMENMRKFIYWVAGISGSSSAAILLGVCKLVGLI